MVSEPCGDVTAAILAGGSSRRMGTDKAMVALGDEPMIRWVANVLEPQVAATLVVGHEVAADCIGARHVADGVDGGLGPLAGLAGALAEATTPFVLAAPCDTPGLPNNLVERLRDAINAHEVAVPELAEKRQPLPCLVRVSTLPHVRRALQREALSVKDWLRERDVVTVDFDAQSRQFANINTPEQLRAYAARHP